MLCPPHLHHPSRLATTCTRPVFSLPTTSRPAPAAWAPPPLRSWPLCPLVLLLGHERLIPSPPQSARQAFPSHLISNRCPQPASPLTGSLILSSWHLSPPDMLYSLLICYLTHTHTRTQAPGNPGQSADSSHSRCTVRCAHPTPATASSLREAQPAPRDRGPGCLSKGGGSPAGMGTKTRGSQPWSPAGDDRRRLDLKPTQLLSRGSGSVGRGMHRGFGRIGKGRKGPSRLRSETAQMPTGLERRLCSSQSFQVCSAASASLLPQGRGGLQASLRARALESGRPTLESQQCPLSKSVASSLPSLSLGTHHRLYFLRENFHKDLRQPGLLVYQGTPSSVKASTLPSPVDIHKLGSQPPSGSQGRCR